MSIFGCELPFSIFHSPEWRSLFLLISGGRFSGPGDPRTVGGARLDAASGDGPCGRRCAWRGYGGCDRRRCGRREWEVHVERDGLSFQATPAGLVSYGFDRLVSPQRAPCFPCVVACLPLIPSDRYHAEAAGEEDEPATSHFWQSRALGAVHVQRFRNGLFAHRRRGGRPAVGLLRLLCPCRQPRQQGAVCARTLSPSSVVNHCCDGFVSTLHAGARGFGRGPRNTKGGRELHQRAKDI